MKNIGKDVKKEFVISSLPACERKEDVYGNILSHLDTKGRKSTTLGFDRPSGRPKYVKGRVPIMQPNC